MEHLSFCDAARRVTHRLARYIYELCKMMTVEGRDKNTLDAFFKDMTAEQKNAIEAVAMDMWEPYINRISHYLPKAKIVFDFFHVVKAFGYHDPDYFALKVKQAFPGRLARKV